MILNKNLNIETEKSVCPGFSVAILRYFCRLCYISFQRLVGPKITFVLKYTVNPLYNDIRYNSKNRYNGDSICTNTSGSSIFTDILMLLYGKTFVLDIY